MNKLQHFLQLYSVPLAVANMAAGKVSMKEPVCLINSDRDGKPCIDPSALRTLEQIDQHVVVVAVVGLYRTGKSYLMNKLAGTSKGFPLGSTIQSKTKGIWMWCVPHPTKDDHTLVLLDTEGLGDVEKGDTENDNWIFALAVLLSSTLVYNSMGTIDNRALENLHYVTELTNHLKIKSKTEKRDDHIDVRSLPSFVWTVRDFCLKLELEGKPITADEYLENALKEKKGTENKKNSQLSSCLRKYFPCRSCFVFERPGNSKTLKRMEELTDGDLDPEFVQMAKEFTRHIYTKSETKTLGDGMKVTGRWLGKLTAAYVNSIRNGEIPCLENAVAALTAIENAKAVEQALACYVQKMNSIHYPTNTKEELSTVHQSSKRDAVALFIKRAFRDEDQQYQRKLVRALEGEYNQICEKNVQKSKKACEHIIKRIFKPLEDHLKGGYYTTTGGYNKFAKDIKMMIDEYNYEQGRGVMAAEVLKTFLDEKAAVGQTILAVDKRLSEAERKQKEAKEKREHLERQARIAAAELHASQLREADLMRTQQEKIRQLLEQHKRQQIEWQKKTKKAEEEHAQRLEDQRRAAVKEKFSENNKMIDNLKEKGYIRSELVEQAFRNVDRADYCVNDFRGSAYMMQPMQYGHIHLSAPNIYTEAMEALDLRPGLSFLNLGSGTGYFSTMVGLILGPFGLNHGVELYPDMVDFAKNKVNIFVNNCDTYTLNRFSRPYFTLGNCLKLGCQWCQYDRVYVGAGVKRQYKMYMINRLKVGGILVMPLENKLVRIVKSCSFNWSSTDLLNVRFKALEI